MNRTDVGGEDVCRAELVVWSDSFLVPSGVKSELVEMGLVKAVLAEVGLDLALGHSQVLLTGGGLLVVGLEGQASLWVSCIQEQSLIDYKTTLHCSKLYDIRK